MTVTRTWTDPSEGGPMDRDTGQTIREQDYDAILSNLLVLGGSSGKDGLSKYNLLVNGGFEIWQRGNGPFTGVAWSVDGWRLNTVGTDVLSVSKSTATVDVGSSASATCTFTLGSGAGTSALFAWPKVSDGHQFRGRTLSLSVRVNTATSNAVRAALTPDGTGGGPTYSAFHTGGGTWQTLTVTTSVPADATSVQVLVYLAASCTAYLDNAMLVVGSVPADYAPLHPADDLARCLRYYEILGSTSIGNIFVGGYHPSAGGTVYGPTPFKVIKPVVPTVTKVGTWATVNAGQPSAGFVALDGCLLSTAIAAAGYGFTNNSAAGTYVSVEANP